MKKNIKAEKESQIQIFEVPNERIDANTHEQLEKTMLEIVNTKSPYIVVDLSKVEYISSVGIRVIIAVAKGARDKGGDIIICGITENVSGVLSMSGLRQFLKVELGIPSAKNEFINGYSLT